MSEIRNAACYGFLLFAIAIVGCSSSEPTAVDPGVPPSPTEPTVYVVNYPLKYFAEQIGGDRVKVVFPAPPDEDPAFWRPDSEIVAAYQKADLILLNGATYAKWIDMASLPESKIVDTSAAFQDQYIRLEDAVLHSHGPEGKHAHEGIAFTTWLDPTLALSHAKAIHAALDELLPDRAAALGENYLALEKDLQTLDAAFEELAAHRRQQPLLASHPVYQNFARRYQLNLKSMHWEPDEMPADDEWAKLDKLLESHAAEWMVWEAPPSDSIRQQLVDRGIHCATFLPLGNVPHKGDYLSVMNENVENLKAIFAD